MRFSCDQEANLPQKDERFSLSNPFSHLPSSQPASQPTNMPGLRLVTLDLTGTVFRFSQLVPATYKALAAKHGMAVEEGDVRRGFGAAFTRLDKEQPHFGGGGGSGNSRRWWNDVIHSTMKGRQTRASYKEAVTHWFRRSGP